MLAAKLWNTGWASLTRCAGCFWLPTYNLCPGLPGCPWQPVGGGFRNASVWMGLIQTHLNQNFGGWDQTLDRLKLAEQPRCSAKLAKWYVRGLLITAESCRDWQHQSFLGAHETLIDEARNVLLKNHRKDAMSHIQGAWEASKHLIDM